MFSKPSDQLANQYAQYLKKAGKFKLRNFEETSIPINDVTSVMSRLGWDMGRMSGMYIWDTVWVRDWSKKTPVSKISFVNHEAKHVGQARKQRNYISWLWRYLTDKDYRCNWEIDAYIRNIETRWMFGDRDFRREISSWSNKLRTMYLLDKKHQTRAKFVWSTVVSRLHRGTHQNVSEIFWRNFLRTRNKRSVRI